MKHLVPPPIQSRCGGYAAVMAMMFLVIISVMAAGFYSVMITSTTIARSEVAANEALAAAESGMEITKLELQKLTFASNPASMLPAIATALATESGRNDINLTSGYYELPSTALRPNGPTYTVQLHSTAEASLLPGYKRLRVVVIGAAGTLTRKLQIAFDVIGATTPSNAFSPFAGMVTKENIYVREGTVQVRNADGTYSTSVFGVKNQENVTVNRNATPYQGPPMNDDPSTVPQAPPGPTAPEPVANPGERPSPPGAEPPNKPKDVHQVWENRRNEYNNWPTAKVTWDKYNNELAIFHAAEQAYQPQLDAHYKNKLGVQEYGDNAVFPVIPASFYEHLEVAAAAQIGDPAVPAKDRITVVQAGDSYSGPFEGIIYFKKGASDAKINGGAQINGVIIVEPDLNRTMDLTLQGGSVELNTQTANAPQFLIDQGFSNFMLIAPTASVSFRASMNRGATQENGILYCGSLTISQQGKLDLMGAVICERDIDIAPNNGGDSGVNIVLTAATAGGSGGGGVTSGSQQLQINPSTYCELP